MSEIIKLRPAEDPDEVLTRAVGVYDEVLVIGWTKEDAMQARSTLGMDAADLLLLVELFKKMLLEEIAE